MWHDHKYFGLSTPTDTTSWQLSQNGLVNWISSNLITNITFMRSILRYLKCRPWLTKRCCTIEMQRRDCHSWRGKGQWKVPHWRLWYRDAENMIILCDWQLLLCLKSIHLYVFGFQEGSAGWSLLHVWTYLRPVTMLAFSSQWVFNNNNSNHAIKCRNQRLFVQFAVNTTFTTMALCKKTWR